MALQMTMLTPVVGCEGDLVCIHISSSGTSGICTPPPGAGQPCAGLVCAAGATCVDTDVVGGAICALSGACGTAGLNCDASFYCSTANGGFACLPLATAGQPCGDVTSGAMTYCYLGYCDFSTSTCVAPGASGETCDASHPCAGLLSCVAGTCQELGSANCPAGGGDGGRP
jgi:hypothetical protein